MSELEQVREMLQSIANGRTAYCGDHLVYSPGPLNKDRVDAALAALDNLRVLREDEVAVSRARLLEHIQEFCCGKGCYWFDTDQCPGQADDECLNGLIQNLQRREDGE